MKFEETGLKDSAAGVIDSRRVRAPGLQMELPALSPQPPDVDCYVGRLET